MLKKKSSYRFFVFANWDIIWDKLSYNYGALIILFCVNSSSPKLQRLFLLLLKTQKRTTHQQVAGENAPNLVSNKS